MDVAGQPVTIKTDSLTSGTVPRSLFGLRASARSAQALPATPLVVTAGEIGTNCSGDGARPLMQAPVEAESSTSLTLLGFAINVSNPTDTPQWENINGEAFDDARCLPQRGHAPNDQHGGRSVPGTLVKVSFDSGTNTVRQAELEH